MPIRTFLFDLGNVLLHFSHERMCAQMGALCGKTGGEIRTLVFESNLQWQFERGQLTETEYHAAFESATGRSVDFQALRIAGSDIFQLNEPMLPILDKLKARGHRLVLLSNTSIAHFEFASARFDVLERFDDFVTSYRVGAIKPERAIFEAAIERIHCDPKDCFYTDDIAQYVDVGRSFGLQAEIFTNAAQLRSQLAERGIVV